MKADLDTTTTTATPEVGTQVRFIGYAENGTGPLKVGDTLTVTTVNPENDSYGVKAVDGTEDTIYGDELEIVLETPKAGKGKGRVKAKPAVEAPAPAAPVAETKGKDKRKGKAPVVAPVATEQEQEETEQEETRKGQDPELLPLKTTASVKAAIAAAKGNIIAAASTVFEQKEHGIFTFGGLLAHVKNGELHTEITDTDGEPVYAAGLKGFNAWVTETFGIKARMAAYYVTLYRVFSTLTTEQKLQAIGWSKLRNLLPLYTAGLLTDENVGQWLDKARKTSCVALQDAVTDELVESDAELHGNTNLSKLRTMKFGFHDDQIAVMEEALSAAKETLGDDTSDGAALIHIVTEWLAARTA